jgi:hypothetical protein
VAIHLALGVLIAGLVGRVSHIHLLVVTVAVPWAQASLLAFWAAGARGKPYTRFLLLMLGLVWIGFVEQRCLNLRLEDSVTASHAMMLSTQTAIVLVVVCLARVAARLRRGAPSTTQPRQVRLATLLAWVGSIAVVLAAARWIWMRSGWTAGVVEDEYFFFACMVGLHNAGYALLAALAVLVGRRSLLFRLAIAGVLVGLVAFFERRILLALFGLDGDLNTVHWMIQAGGQLVVISATLVLWRLAQRRSGGRAATSSLADPVPGR